jgi:hypothetical protein
MRRVLYRIRVITSWRDQREGLSNETRWVRIIFHDVGVTKEIRNVDCSGESW